MSFAKTMRAAQSVGYVTKKSSDIDFKWMNIMVYKLDTNKVEFLTVTSLLSRQRAWWQDAGRLDARIVDEILQPYLSLYWNPC